MQPPRGNASPGGVGPGPDDVVDRIRGWAKRPTAEATIALCDELRAHAEVRGNHVDVLAKAVAQRHAKDSRVLLALGRLQLAVGKLADAQQTLVTAGRLEPQSRTAYRYIGEVLLRRGDAARAEKMFSRCLEIDRATGESIDDGTDEWLRRARANRPLQDQKGEGAVAADIAAQFPPTGPGRRSTTGPRQSLRAPAAVVSPTDDEPTQAGVIPDALRPQLKAPPPRTSASSRPEDQQTAPGVYVPPPSRPPPPKPVSSLPPPIPPRAPTPAPTPAVRGPAPIAVRPLEGRVSAPSDARSLLPLGELSDMTTLPVADGELIEAGDNPTIRLDRELDSEPRMGAPPRAADDASPLPSAPPPGAGAKPRPIPAISASAVTFGDDEVTTLIAPPRESRGASVPAPADAPARSDRAGAAGTLGDRAWPTEHVLDALADAGIYERGAAAASPAAWMRRRDIARPGRRGSIAIYVGLFAFVGGGIAGGLWYGQSQKRKHRDEAETRAQHAEALVEQSGLGALTEAEVDLGRAFELDSRTMRGARVWLEDRVLRSYVWPTENRREGGLASAMERGKAVGLGEADMAFARIALALSSDDTPGAAAMAKSLDPGTATDKNAAWTELSVGWVLERAGDARAVERYAHAAALDPQLVPARLYLAKLAALAGDAERVTTLTKDVSDDLAPTRDDLLALAGSVQGAPSAPKPGRDDARRPNGFGWIVPALVVGDPKAPADARKAAAEKAVQLADSPADLTRVGRLAASAGDEATASRAALRALEVSPIFSPARALAARLALLVGRPDDAARALENAASEPEINALRGWLAYERGDLPAVQKALDDPTLGKDGDTPSIERADLASIVKPLRFALAIAQRPSATLSAKDAAELPTIGALGELGPLVAFDVAIDGGDLKDASAIAASWGSETANLEARPLRALRLARLARMTGRGEDADRLSRIAVEQATVVPRALVERVLVLGALGKGADALALLGRYPLLATDEQPWLRAYANAQAGKTADAKKLVADLKDPDRKTATWAVRRDALLAIAAAGDDKRAKPMAHDMLRERPNDPDVQTVAKSLGVK